MLYGPVDSHGNPYHKKKILSGLSVVLLLSPDEMKKLLVSKEAANLDDNLDPASCISAVSSFFFFWVLAAVYLQRLLIYRQYDEKEIEQPPKSF